MSMSAVHVHDTTCEGLLQTTKDSFQLQTSVLISVLPMPKDSSLPATPACYGALI